jgi:hypothetical protein
MRKSLTVCVVALLVTVLMANIASAETVIMEGKNANVKHVFYGSVNASSANISFAELESISFVTKNGNVDIDFVDWGKDSCRNAILIKVTYQDQSTIVILERGVWGGQVANLRLDKNATITIGLMEIFPGSPTRYAKISASLWVQG